MNSAVKFFAAVSVVAITLGSAHASVYTVDLTGMISDFSETTFNSGGSHYDRFILTPLSGLDSSNAITVSQGDTINSTVTLDNPYFIPTSPSYTNILQFFTGSSFPSENTEVQGTFDFYDGGSLVGSFTYLSTTSNSLASYAANFPPNNAGFTFDSFTNDFQITTLGIPATLDGSYFFYDLVQVPEPSALALFGAGLVGFAGFAAYRRRKTMTAA